VAGGAGPAQMDEFPCRRFTIEHLRGSSRSSNAEFSLSESLTGETRYEGHHDMSRPYLSRTSQIPTKDTRKERNPPFSTAAVLPPADGAEGLVVHFEINVWARLPGGGTTSKPEDVGGARSSDGPGAGVVQCARGRRCEGTGAASVGTKAGGADALAVFFGSPERKHSAARFLRRVCSSGADVTTSPPEGPRDHEGGLMYTISGKRIPVVMNIGREALTARA